jgi:uncharacterized protein YjiK
VFKLPATRRRCAVSGLLILAALAYDPATQRLFVAKENDPVRIYQVDGFFNAAGQPSNVEISLDIKRARRLFLTDISGMSSTSVPGTCWCCPMSRSR